MKKRALGVQIAAWRNGVQETQTSLETNCIIEPPAAVCVSETETEKTERIPMDQSRQNSGSGSYLGPTESWSYAQVPPPQPGRGSGGSQEVSVGRKAHSGFNPSPSLLGCLTLQTLSHKVCWRHRKLRAEYREAQQSVGLVI